MLAEDVGYPQMTIESAAPMSNRHVCERVRFLTALSFFVVVATATAQTVPPLINYQGRLTGADGAGIEGTRKLEFCIWKDVASSASTNLIWGPQTFAAVPLVNGHFNVILGTTDTNGRSIADAFGGTSRYLETTVYDANGLTYATIAPRQQILSAPYALTARLAHNASKVEGGLIEGTPIGQETPERGRFTLVEVNDAATIAGLGIEEGRISPTHADIDIRLTTEGLGIPFLTGDYLFGDGSDGSFSSTGNFELGGTRYYENFTLNTGHTLMIPARHKFLILIVRGTCTLSGAIVGTGNGGVGATTEAMGEKGKGIGGSGGGGGGDHNSGAGTDGAYCELLNGMTINGGIGSYNFYSGGHGKSSGVLHKAIVTQQFQVGYGAGGSRGGGTTSASPGGSGGAGLMIICWNLVVSGNPTITSNGNNGSIGNPNPAGGSGGGGGGSVQIYYEQLTGTLPTPTLNGGAGSIGGNNNGKNGGNGGNGSYVFKQL